MSKDTKSLNAKLYKLLKVRGYKPSPLDATNNRVSASQDADVIEFTFDKNNKEKSWVSIDDANQVIVYYDDEQGDTLRETMPNGEYDDTWTGFLTTLKNWAMRKQLKFKLSNKDHLGDDMKQREYHKMKENVSEGYHAMGKSKSYNDNVKEVKIVLQHSRNIEEGEQRYRNVAKIYLENTDGERILAPTNKPGVAQIYARHLAEGGQPHDERWNHLKGLCEEYNKMAGFVRATRNGEFTESAQELVQVGINHYNKLRESLSKMRGPRGYNAYFESWSPPLMEDENDGSINELFVQETMDPRIESVMPILSRLHKKVNEMNEVGMLESWAEGVINDKLELDETSEEKLRGYLGGHEERMPAIKAKMNKAGAVADEGHWPAERQQASKEWDALYKTKQKREKGYNLAKKQLVKKAYGVELDEEPEIDEGKGLWDNIHAKRKRIKAGSGERMRKPGSEGAPTAADLKASRTESLEPWMNKDDAENSNEPAFMRKKKHEDNMKAATGGSAVRTAKNKPEDELDENFISMDAQAVAEEDEIEEGLDANQKRVGQLGPTEKVKNNNIGKLVGANESTEYDQEMARIMEIARFRR